MCALFKNKYLIGSKRYWDYDYSLPGKYFITICTKNRIPYFGAIVNGKMVLSDYGKIADQLWTEIPRHFSFTDLDEYIIMPDHIHGIIIIKYQFSQIDDGIFVDPLHATGLQKPATGLPKNEHMAHISPKNGSLASIIRSYKSVVSKCIHSTDPGFEWQPRFHDHIIRTNIELIRIRNYIIRNPEKFK